MRLTIIDTQTLAVAEVLQVATITPETFAQVCALAAQYRHESYRWFVTKAGAQPLGFQHDHCGQPVFVRPLTPIERDGGAAYEARQNTGVDY